MKYRVMSLAILLAGCNQTTPTPPAEQTPTNTTSASSTAPTRQFSLSGEVGAPQAEVWKAFMTSEGVETFFAPKAKIDPKLGGLYEVYLRPDLPAGRQGSEGVSILAYEPPHRFVLGWNAPPWYGPLRDQKTAVEFQFDPTADGGTTVTINHWGFGHGPKWDEIRQDFQTLYWPIVLGRLQYRFERGVVDWNNKPDGQAYFRGDKAKSPAPKATSS